MEQLGKRRLRKRKRKHFQTWMLAKLGILAKEIIIDGSSIGRAAREHIRIVAPEGGSIAGRIRPEHD